MHGLKIRAQEHSLHTEPEQVQDVFQVKLRIGSELLGRNLRDQTVRGAEQMRCEIKQGCHYVNLRCSNRTIAVIPAWIVTVITMSHEIITTK